MKTALLVIDVQQGLCEGEHNTFESQRVIERINIVAEKTRAAAAVVVFIQHEADCGFMQAGSRERQLAVGLEQAPGDLLVRKTTPDSFNRTELGELLRQHEITQLVICGMHTEFCVDTTTRRALALGYPVILVADAHTTEDNAQLSAAQIIQHHNDTLSNIVSFGVRVRTIFSGDLNIKS